MDKTLFYFFNHNLAFPLLDPLVSIISDERFLGGIAFAAFFYAFSLNRMWRRFALTTVLLITFLDNFGYLVLKPAFQRLRPCHELKDARLVESHCGSEFGFPSNHAMNSAGAATLFSMWSGGSHLGAALFSVLLICVSRLYLGVHYPSDVLGGALIGALFALLFYAPFSFRWLKKS